MREPHTPSSCSCPRAHIRSASHHVQSRTRHTNTTNLLQLQLSVRRQKLRAETLFIRNRDADVLETDPVTYVLFEGSHLTGPALFDMSHHRRGHLKPPSSGRPVLQHRVGVNEPHHEPSRCGVVNN